MNDVAQLAGAAVSRMLKGLLRTNRVEQKKIIALEAGVHEPTVSRWADEENPSLPDAAQLAAICRAIDINPAEIIFRYRARLSVQS